MVLKKERKILLYPPTAFPRRMPLPWISFDRVVSLVWEARREALLAKLDI